MKCNINKILLLLVILSAFFFPMGMTAYGENNSDLPVSISNIDEDDQSIGGTGIPGAEIKIDFSNGVTLDTVVGSDGLWQINVPVEMKLSAGLEVTVTHTVNIDPDGKITVENLSRSSSLARVGDILKYTTSIWNNESEIVLKDVYFTHTFSDQIELIETDQNLGDKEINPPLLYNKNEKISTSYIYDSQTKTIKIQIDSLTPDDEYEFVYYVEVTQGFNTTITGAAEVGAAPEISILTTTVLGEESEHENFYKVSYNFISGTEGKELSEEVMALLPQNQTDKIDGATVTPPKLSQTEVATKKGTWAFKSWDKDSAVINGADVVFTGTWVFIEDETKDPAGADPADKKPAAAKETDKEKAPKTGESTNELIYICMLFISFTAVFGLSLKKGNLDRKQ